MTDRDVSLRDAERSARARDAEPVAVATLARIRDLEVALEQKTRLLHELDHRSKNTVQLISSLLQLQLRRLADPAAKDAIKAMLGRVNAIAGMHRRQLQLDGGLSFDVSAFVRDIAADLLETTNRKDIALQLDLADLKVPAVSGAPLALIVNELVANAIAHAFPHRGGTIGITIRQEGGADLIEVSDDGVGLAGAEPGCGFGLVELLAKQLSAEVLKTDTDHGFSVTLVLPAEQSRSLNAD